MNQGDIVTADIASVNSEGEGVARVGEDGFVLFVPGVLPGERVVCRVARTSKKYAACSVVDILTPSKDRVTPRCPSYDRCGGCQLQHASYEAQLGIKRTILTDALRRIGKIEPPRAVNCLPSPSEWAYRNKTALPVQAASKGKSLICGYYERMSHRVVPFRECAVLEPSIERAAKLTIEAIAESGFTGWDERKKTGDIRHIVLRSGISDAPDASSGVLTGVVTARELSAREFGKLKNTEQRICGKDSKDSALVGAVLNIKSGGGNFIWGPVFKPLCGKRFIDQALDGYRFRTDISAFFQVNPRQAESVFRYVRDAAAKGKTPERLLELYSGVGGLTAYLAGVAGKVDAVEEWRQACRQMKENMTSNGIENVESHEDSAENFMERDDVAIPGAYDSVVLDPPRTGCDERVIEGVKKIAPQKIVYVSCNPATLARDLSRIISPSAGVAYELESLEAFDMFPQTAHVESVAVITRITGR
ncbi:MAG: 23S rRNA (uracil(1939)-C(5))-methyltransferase RlmD [Synergistaceae bacterium]|jgi:23S rRNA (uracil1939-C5)-methyltransferase|nr:23S rRNA (uracil(1939)-C(5))-methyltransferase RlmD [Synergistaceae bacterium]